MLDVTERDTLEAAAAVRPVVFSTEGHGLRHRLDAYSAQVGPHHDFVVPNEQQNGFEATCTAWRLGKLLFTANNTGAIRRTRGPRQVARDGLDHWVLRVCRTGTVRTRLGDAVHTTGPRQLIAYSYADTFDADWKQSQWVSLLIPRDNFPALTVGLSHATPGIKTGSLAGMLADLLLSLPEHLARANDQETNVIGEAIASTVAACLLGGAQSAWAPEQERFGDLAVRERVRRIIRENIGSPRLTPERICHAAGVSRSSLYRMFEIDGGVARYVQRTRLALFREALRDPALARESVAALGERFGFYDGSALRRVFKRTYGATPREMRAAGLLDAPLSVDPRHLTMLPQDASFTTLLRQLVAS